MSLNNVKIRCKSYWNKDINETKDLEEFVNKCIDKVSEKHEVYDFSVSEDSRGYYTVCVKYKDYGEDELE